MDFLQLLQHISEAGFFGEERDDERGEKQKITDVGDECPPIIMIDGKNGSFFITVIG